MLSDTHWFLIAGLLCVSWGSLTIIQQHDRIRQLQRQVSQLKAQAAEQARLIATADQIVEANRQAAHSELSPSPQQLMAEINRLRQHNAVLSGAYQMVQIVDARGKRQIVRIAWN